MHADIDETVGILRMHHAQRGIDFADERFDYGEPRFVAYGYMNGRLIATVYTQRGNAMRIISMRKANTREEKLYG